VPVFERVDRTVCQEGGSLEVGGQFAPQGIRFCVRLTRAISDPARETWVGGAPDQVAVRRSDVRTLGASEPVRADDALLRAAAVTAADGHPPPLRRPAGAHLPGAEAVERLVDAATGVLPPDLLDGLHQCGDGHAARQAVK
jgi:hypothetical protein